MNELKHHLVLGEMEDFLTGETIEDNHDERLRQKIARFLVERKGFDKSDIAVRIELVAAAGDKKARLKIDFCVRLFDKAVLVVKYGPGSLVTRRRPALAASRILEPYQIPFVAVSNGIDAELVDGASGKIIGDSLESIPDKKELANRFDSLDFSPVEHKRAEMESRILYAYEVDDACPCDGNVCRL
jgi:hypothetical protein